MDDTALAQRAKQTKDRVHSERRSRLPDAVNDLIDHLRRAEVFFYGAGLAFYGLISVAPFLVVGFWAAAGVAGEDRIDSLAENLADIAPGEVDVEPAIQNLLEVGTGVGIIALFTALWPATAYGGGLVRGFDELSPAENRSAGGLRGRVKSLALLIALPVVLLGGLAVSSVLTGLVDDGWAVRMLAWAGAVVVGTLVTAVGLVGIYRLFGPDDLSFRSLATGAAAAAAGITVMSAGYLVYLDQGADWEERVAGSGLATVVLLALWLYLSNVILLSGYAVALACSDIDPSVEDRSEGDDGDDDSDDDAPSGDGEGRNLDAPRLSSTDPAATSAAGPPG
jgi:membrane protein